MASTYARSASEPRERRSHPRERGERGNFWNPSVPRNLDADTWRRGGDVSNEQQQSVQQGPPPPVAGGRGRDDRPRIRNERPSSRDGRGSGGDYRHSRDYPNGARYSNTFRGRGRGRGNSRNEAIIDVKGYRHYQPRYGPPSGGNGSTSGPMTMGSGQGTQFFSPLNVAPPPDQSKFNASEALMLFQQRWQAISSDLNNNSLPSEQKPVLYKAESAQNGVWGQPKWHVQASVPDFLTGLKEAIERDQKKLIEAQEANPSQAEPPSGSTDDL